MKARRLPEIRAQHSQTSTARSLPFLPSHQQDISDDVPMPEKDQALLKAVRRASLRALRATPYVLRLRSRLRLALVKVTGTLFRAGCLFPRGAPPQCFEAWCRHAGNKDKGVVVLSGLLGYLNETELDMHI
ncbi:hypothetical protein HPB47_021777 [Ixodes persulcatus]|uniref:Uncharacterized protein n=1 Tax=Ixodes persulcatus TaxID=34615 RepID=A0AC60QBR5_IXOPE|nr:hypothetical protein HPB47_021777 [Ixodes persulcatus]